MNKTTRRDFMAFTVALLLASPSTLNVADTLKPLEVFNSGDGPRFKLRSGEKYFRVDGKQAFVLGPQQAKPLSLFWSIIAAE
jgi:hypothetical protein